ncbi:MAG: ROK family transcriptional regulator [Chloroflexota bacterium]|nr:MAG: ROK family transcriptional regulator [Chloroflexota bacterium]
MNPLGNRDLIRAINRSTVINMIKTFGPIARAEIARRSGLSPATVTGITAELIEQKLVFEKTSGDSSGGRPPILLAINPTGAYVIGIKLTETEAIAALTDLEANVLNKYNASLTGQTPEIVANDLSLVVDNLLHQSGIQKKQLFGVGIGLAGIVDGVQGVLRHSPIFHWRDVPLKSILENHLHVPVYIENDVNTLTLAEKWFGAGQNTDHFLTVTVGRGVGLGIVLNGQFYRGAGGGAGEFGHTVINPEGPACECGKRGCLEAYVSDPALLNAAAAAGAQVGTIEALVDLAKSGDPEAKKIFCRAGEILGLGIANLVNLLNPRKIIISGEGTRAGNLLFGPMAESVQRNVMPGLSYDTSIQVDPWGDDVWARGAATLVLRELFESPVHREAVIVTEVSSVD